MSVSHKYKTFDQLLEEVTIDFQSYALEGMIEPQQLIKVATRVNYDLGLRIHRTKDTVIDIETSPDQDLFGFRGWGNTNSELLNFNSESGEVLHTYSIFEGTGDAFALVADNRSRWLFVANENGGSDLILFLDGLYHQKDTLDVIVVGAAGLE